MERITCPALEIAAALLHDKKYQQALDALAQVDPGSLSFQDKAYKQLLYCQAKLRLSEYDFDSDLTAALDYYRDSGDNWSFAEAKYLQGRLLSSLGLHSEAREVLLESYSAFKRCLDGQGQALVLNQSALVNMQIGDMETAANNLISCIGIYRALDDEDAASAARANLGAVYYSMGLLKKALAAYAPLAQYVRKRGAKSSALYYFNHAIPHALMGHYRVAMQELAASLEFLDDFPREKAIYYENLGWVHLLSGEYKEAETALMQGLEISLKIAPESALISQIKRRLADAHFGLGNDELARQYADEALVVAEKINERIEIAAVWRVYGQLAVRQQNHAGAREWFKKAADLFAMIGSQYELAVTRYLAATSGIYQNGERQALLYLAREYFAREEVGHYVEKINAELSRARPAPARTRRADNGPPVVIAVNAEMKRLVELAEHVAPSGMTVLLTGPTGSGKDLLAKFIHYHSGRAGKFVSINAAAIPDHMIEAELFGYRKGAYTGADRTTPGLFEEADGGTLYLNEIGDASLELQAKLLDVLESKTVRRLGEREGRQVDFRLIAATNLDVDQMIREGRFRLDLYHRLNEIRLTLPPLAERPEDIGALVVHFLSLSGVNVDGNGSESDCDQLVQALSAMEWPGNVRELEAQVRRLVLVTKGDVGAMQSLVVPVAQSEGERLAVVLRRTGGNRSQAAKVLGVSEGAVRHRMRKYGLSEPTER
jgi:DNA-binding NtrC family response regulator/Tfp pilus assembly protein PilF